MIICAICGSLLSNDYSVNNYVCKYCKDKTKTDLPLYNKDRICPLWKTLPNHDCSECPHADDSCIMIKPNRAIDYINGD